MNDLVDRLSDLTPEQWRTVLLAASAARCIACGLHDGCDCDDETDAAKERVTARAVEVGTG